MRDFEIMVSSHIGFRIQAETQEEAERIALAKYSKLSTQKPYISWVKEYVKK